jgi:MFS family permease
MAAPATDLSRGAREAAGGAAAMLARRRMRDFVVDFSPLRLREFRLLFAGQLVSTAGSTITMVALPYQCYQLTRSTLAVGLLGLAQIVPIVVLALVSGALADAVDRRRLVLAAEAGAALVGAALVVNALLAEPLVWPLFVCATLGAACYALLRPPMDAMVPRLVPREQLKAAMALEWMRSDVGVLVGPAVGGVLIAVAGLAVAYAVDVLSFLLSIGCLLAMRATPPPENADRVSLRSIADGFRYAVSCQELLGSYLVDINAMLMAMPTALFPAVAERYGGAEVVGALYSAPAAGSLVVAATSGWSRRVHRHGRAITLAAAGWGAAILGFGLVDALIPALALLALAGGMDAISGLFRATLWNETIPDRLRGRLAGIEMVSWSSGPAVGQVRAGAVASLAGVRASIVSGGAICIAGCVVLALVLPRFWHYDARERSRPDAR